MSVPAVEPTLPINVNPLVEAQDVPVTQNLISPQNMQAMQDSVIAPRFNYKASGLFSKGPNSVAALLGSGAALNKPTGADLGIGGKGPDFGSVVKNIIDFMSTPLYMVTNTAIENQNDPDQNNIGNVLNDIGKGISEGWQAGVDHNPQYARDWTDVISNAEDKAGMSADQKANLAPFNGGVGFAGDLLLDPLNLIPGAGVAEGIGKGVLKGVSAAREASSAGARILGNAADKAAADTIEPIAQNAVKDAQKAELAVQGPGATTTVEAPTEAPAPVNSLSEQFAKTPEVQAIKVNQSKGVVGAFGNAFGSAFKDSVANSPAAKLLKTAFKQPLPVPSENIDLAKIEGLVNQDKLSKEPIATTVPVEPEVNPEKDIAEKHFGEGGHDFYKSMKEAVEGINWTKDEPKYKAASDEYDKQVTAASAAGMDMSSIPSREEFIAKQTGLNAPTSKIPHPFTKGNIQAAQKYLREQATPEERAMAAKAIGISEHTPPAELTKQFFSHKDNYLNAGKEIDGLYKKEADTPIEEAKAAATKEHDISNASVNNTLTHAVYENATPEQRQATRVKMAKSYNDALNTPENVAVFGEAKEGGKTKWVNGSRPLKPERQHEIAQEMAQEVSEHQSQELERETKTGYRMTAERAAGESKEGIVHPLLYRTESNQLMVKSAISRLKTEINKKLEGVGARVSKFSDPSKGLTALPELVVKHMRAAESLIAARGMIPALTWAGEKGSGAVRLFMGDVLEAIIKGTEGLKGAKDMLTSNDIRRFLIGSAAKDQVNPMAFLTGIEKLVRDRKLIREEMVKAGGALKPERMEELLSQSEKSIHSILMGKDSAYPGATKAEIANVKSTIQAAAKARGEGANVASYSVDMENLAKKMVRDPHLGTMLEQRHLYNEAVHSADIQKYAESNWKDLAETLRGYAASNMDSQAIVKWLNDNIKDSMDILSYTDRGSYLDDLRQLKESVIKPEEEKAATDWHSPQVVTDSQETARAAVETRSADPNEVVSVTDLRLGAIVTDMMRAMHPVRSFFDSKFPFLGSAFYDAVISGNHSRARYVNMMNQMLYGHVLKNNKVDQLLADLKAVQNHSMEEGAVLPDSAQDLDKIIGTMFHPNQPYVRGIREGKINPNYLKGVLEDKRVTQFIDKDWFKSAKGDEILDFWLHTNLKDSVDAAKFLSHTNRALAHVYNDIAIVRDFENRFATTDLRKAQAGGFTKITWNKRNTSTGLVKWKDYNGAVTNAEKQNGFYDLLDKNKYYDPVAAKEIPAIHRLMNESRRIESNTRVGHFVNNVYDPYTQILKAFQTTFRPGHWVSNIMGDTLRLVMAGIHPGAVGASLHVLKAVGKDDGMITDIPTSLDRLTRELNRDFKTGTPKDDKTYLIDAGDKKVPVAVTEIGRRFQNNGTYVTAHAMGQHEDFIAPEDLNALSGMAKGINQSLDKVLFTGGNHSVAALGAMRDNLTRGPLAMHILLTGKFKSLDDAFEQAGAFVRKWAPTSMDFTREESMYARRVVLYYTWLRGMLPNVVETMMERPANFLVANKALYSIAKSNGVDPMSIGNPFPLNEQFPSYYYENIIGPQFRVDGSQLWGFSPMAPSIDVLDTMLGSLNSYNAKQGPGPGLAAMGGNLVGMLNPALKMPIELAMGSSGGVPITDPAQYVQDEIAPPQLDLLSKLTGKELYNPTVNRTDKFNTENTPNVPNVPGVVGRPDVFNFLTGLHATDYTSPASMKAVRGEQSNLKSILKANVKRTNS